MALQAAASLPLPVLAAGAAATGAYLNARWSLAHDALWLKVAGSSIFNIARATRADRINVFYILEKHALDKSLASRPFILFEGKSYSYLETYNRVLQLGTWLRERHGVQPGDIVAMNYMNSETFIFLWFAMWAVGAKPAFINYNLTGAALAHCLRASSARLCVIDPRVAENTTEEVREELERVQGMKFVVLTDEVERLEVGMTEGVRYPDKCRSESRYVNMAVLIYTSGTTGMPKPAVVSWTKVYTAAAMGGKGTSCGRGDVLYTCMPLYHSSASCIGVCSALFSGAAVAIGRKFSTRTFWKEVRETQSTIIQYVGETCRYLAVAAPEVDPATSENMDGKGHRVRIAFGNGLRPDVWDKFKERFNIPTIFEFYAATEGPLGTWNLSTNDYAKGAIGRFGLISNTIVGLRSAIVKLDIETELPYRDPATGFCQRVSKTGAGEPGELLVKLPADDIQARFQGYFGNENATNSKLMRDVFRKGDAWFRSGDLLRWDGEGRLYFSDRIGDTFRWKSENVSTAEVAEALGKHPQVQEANVYGVLVPNHDGRAGCAVVAFAPTQSYPPSPELLRSLAKHVADTLPRYAYPLFLRVVREVGLQNTGTNKQQKHGLRVQGVDPVQVEKSAEGGLLYWLRDGTYVPFGKKDWRAITGGKVKL